MGVNLVAHYFGAISDNCRDSLKSLDAITAPPDIRSIAVGDARKEWLAKIGTSTRKGCMPRLSEMASA
jgi:hypothetical protein